MKDRFKFRFWNKLSNIMTYNFMFGNFMQKSLEDYEKKDWVGLNYEPNYICFNNKGIEDNLVIMQSTGLKDKNGKLIYEGDTSHFIFPKCNFKKDLEEIMFKQARHFGTQNRLFGTKLKELLKEESK